MTKKEKKEVKIEKPKAHNKLKYKKKIKILI